MDKSKSGIVITGDALPPEVKVSLEKVCEKLGFLVGSYSADVKIFNTNGGSFLAKLFLVTIKGTSDVEKKTCHVFVKCIIANEIIDNVLDLKQCYASEAYIYNELSNIFDDLQDDAGIPEYERFNMVKSYGESTPEAIILENVAINGFKACGIDYVMDLNVAELAMEQLAKFHALSFVIEKKRPEYFLKIKEMKTPYSLSEEMLKATSNFASISTKHVKEDTRIRLQNFMPRFLSNWKRYLAPSSTRSCLCHGDFRLNNLLMKETAGKITKVIISDYQHIYYGSPVNDLLYFIFIGSTRDFRKKYLHYLKQFYFKALTNFLVNFGLEVEDIYPKKQFDDDWTERLEYGLNCAMNYMPLFMSMGRDSDTLDLGAEDMSAIEFQVHKDFPERMQGVADDFVEWGFL